MRLILSFIKNIFIFTYALVVFKLQGKASSKGYQSMIRLFCLTGGWSNDLLSKIISLTHTIKSENCHSKKFGSFSSQQMDHIVKDISENGFHILESKLDEQSLNYFFNYAHLVKPEVRLMDEEIQSGTPSKGRIAYDKNNLVAIRYDYSEDELINDELVQDLIGDPLFVSIAERYLKAEPKIDITTLWWHTSFSQKADDNAAMMFHFDMDRIKWLKIFVYITDVGPANGPHCFVKRSHRTGGIPKSMLDKGYARLSDEEVESYYGKDSLIEFSAPRGTIIFEDTRGLHKGKHVEEGSRLIFQLEYTNSLFGGRGSQSRIESVRSLVLANTKKRYKNLLKWYHS